VCGLKYSSSSEISHEELLGLGVEWMTEVLLPTKLGSGRRLMMDAPDVLFSLKQKELNEYILYTEL